MKLQIKYDKAVNENFPAISVFACASNLVFDDVSVLVFNDARLLVFNAEIAKYYYFNNSINQHHVPSD